MQSSNITAIIIAVITATPPTIVALLSLKEVRKNKEAVKEIHVLINSRMNELLETATGEATLKGRAMERKDAETRK